MESHAPYAAPHAAVAMRRCASGSDATPRWWLLFFVSLSSFFFDLLSTAEGAHNEDHGTWVLPHVPRHVIHMTYRRRLSIACSETE